MPRITLCMKNVVQFIIITICIFFLVPGCGERQQNHLFTSLSSEQTGITFSNDIDETKLPGDALNEFAYMGGGVGVIDVNNDGLKDLFFCGNQVSSKLYLNKGNHHFEDITQSAGVSTSDWITGVSVVDINADGYDDIYLCTYGKTLGEHSRNVLFINQHNNSFKEEAVEYGLADTSYSTQAVFFDYDKDGDLDMYLSNYMLNASYSANYLFSKNDLWLNNKNGTFTNVLDKSTKHQSYSSMGCDAADINNDALFDFASVDMMPEDNYRKKQTFSFMSYDRYNEERDLSYSPEFMRDMLQLNNGNYQRGDTSVPFFSEIGQMAGISETDWSWSILFADFNNDGYKDLHITNGIGRDFINSDFIAFSQNSGQATNEEQFRKQLRDKLVALKHVAIPNYLYLNNGNYTFSNITDSSGIKQNSMSNGAAYVDLDNDGDLDLVVNNIDQPAFVLINNENQPNKPKINHSISFILKGDSLNIKGFGAKVFVYINGKSQMQEEYPVRGYLSTVDTKLLFGTGKNTKADSVVIVWANNQKQAAQNLSTD